MRDKRELLNELLDDLVRQNKAGDAVKLLIESGDLESALTIARKARLTFDAIIEKIEHAAAGPSRPAPMGDTPSNSFPQPAAPGRDEDMEMIEKALESLSFQKIKAFLIGTPLRKGISATTALLSLGFFTYTAWINHNHGLTAEYFIDRDLTKSFLMKKDVSINFRWMRRAPRGLPSANDFSIRWRGKILAPAAGDYELFTLSDDGVRLWVDDRLLIDNWGVHGATLNSAIVKLTAGLHSIRIEYFNGEGDSVLKLMWKQPGEKNRAIVKPKFLVPDEPSA